MNFYYHRYAELHRDYFHITTQLDHKTTELKKIQIDLQNTQDRYINTLCFCAWNGITCAGFQLFTRTDMSSGKSLLVLYSYFNILLILILEQRQTHFEEYIYL